MRTCVGGFTCSGSNIDSEKCNTDSCPGIKIYHLYQGFMYYQQGFLCGDGGGVWVWCVGGGGGELCPPWEFYHFKF